MKNSIIEHIRSEKLVPRLSAFGISLSVKMFLMEKNVAVLFTIASNCYMLSCHLNDR